MTDKNPQQTPATYHQGGETNPACKHDWVFHATPHASHPGMWVCGYRCGAFSYSNPKDPSFRYTDGPAVEKKLPPLAVEGARMKEP